MRYRKKIQILPGVYINFSKSGISLTFGVKGASINIGKNGNYLNTGIPGTGLYNRQKIGGSTKGIPKNIKPNIQSNGGVVNNTTKIKYANISKISSINLNGLRDSIVECSKNRKEISISISKAKSNAKRSSILMGLSYIFIFGFFIKKIKTIHSNNKNKLEELFIQLEKCNINADLNLSDELINKYEKVYNAFQSLLNSNKICELISDTPLNNSKFHTTVEKLNFHKPIKFATINSKLIKSSYDAMYLQNHSGGGLFIYPAFVLIVDNKKQIAVIDLKDLQIDLNEYLLIEENEIPNDSIIVDKTWAKSNKDGSKDMRFKNNYEVPICRYGKILFSSSTGLNEAFLISNYENSLNFYTQFSKYLTIIKNQT